MRISQVLHEKAVAVDQQLRAIELGTQRATKAEMHDLRTQRTTWLDAADIARRMEREQDAQGKQA